MAGESAQAYVCPRCGRTSHNPNDVREGYCGNCHDWTRDEFADLPDPIREILEDDTVEEQ